MFRRLILITVAVTFAACSAARKPADESTATGALATCTGCHGNPDNGNAAPPRAVNGATATTDIGVGAHQTHLHPSAFRQPIACTECHVVPATVDAPGHIDQGTATLTWGPLATANGALPTFQVSADGTTATCTNYCHGGTFAANNGALHTPSWTVVDGSQAGCGTCHSIPPPPPHPSVASATQCGTCHPDTVNPDGSINVGNGRHINGIVDLAGGSTTCTACHGDPTRTPATIAPAPPKDTKGNVDPSAPGVGAHQPHLTNGPIRAALPCESCHVVPTDLSHVTQPLNLTWSALAKTGYVAPAAPTFDPNALTCTNYCHGANLAAGGSNTTPVWTGGPSQAACGTCHAIPPPVSSGHPQVASDPTTCGLCHPGTVKADGTIDTSGGKHINGAVDVSNVCTDCHGDATRTPASIAAAPPKDTKGNTATSAPGVGAHQTHLNAGPLSGPIGCGECHLVPTDLTHATQPLNLTWGTLATTGGVAPTFDPTALTCTNYCHGASLNGGANTKPVWNGTGQAVCGSCHGLPPATGQHDAQAHQGFPCTDCHGSGYTATSVNVPTHVNGVKDVGLSGSLINSWVPPTATTPGSCTPTCHGTQNW